MLLRVRERARVAMLWFALAGRISAHPLHDLSEGLGVVGLGLEERVKLDLTFRVKLKQV